MNESGEAARHTYAQGNTWDTASYTGVVHRNGGI